jgi:hypothetical protein
MNWDLISFLGLSNFSLYKYTTVYSLPEGHLGYSHGLAIMSKLSEIFENLFFVCILALNSFE